MKRYGVLIALLVSALLLSMAIAQQPQQRKKPVVPTGKIVLFNGKDLSGFKPVLRYPSLDPAKTWSVKDGVIRCQGQDNAYGFLRTETDYADYLLHVEWRWPEKGGNSGVLVHMVGPDKVWPMCFECQLYADHAGDFLVIGEGPKYSQRIMTREWAQQGRRVAGRKIEKLNKSSEKPVGQWNTYEIICKDDWMVILVNGVLQNIATGASITSGKICLQSEGAPIEFRNIYLEPLD